MQRTGAQRKSSKATTPGSRKILERHVKQALKKRLDELGCYHYWPVPMGIGAATIDCIVCYKGRFIGIETKRPGEKPTPLQKLILEKIKLSGGITFVIDNPDDAAKLEL